MKRLIEPKPNNTKETVLRLFIQIGGKRIKSHFFSQRASGTLSPSSILGGRTKLILRHPTVS